MSQFSLLNTPRFGPFFWTQFFGAFNDNLFKNALLITFAFHGVTHGATESGMDASTMVNLSAGLFILPFFLFSALAGQLADKYEKGSLIRWIKVCEIILMTLAAIGFVFELPWVLMTLLFLMGTQSAFFGPVKYSILPQHLGDDELVGGNGMVEMGTFLAILLGTIFGGVLIALRHGSLTVAAAIITVAVLGWLTSLKIPKAPAAAEDLKINFNPLTQTFKLMGFTRQNIVVFRSILGISWFWFFGAIFLAQMPTFTEQVLHANEHVVTLLLTLFSVGIGTGSLMCEKLSNKRVELGLVPLGAAGLTLFALDLFWTCTHLPELSNLGISAFIATPIHWRLMLDLLAIGLFGGFYIVPLYALIQQRSPAENRSRVIAGNNVLNALFMVMAALLAIVFLKQGYSIPQLFLLVGLLNALVSIYIFILVPEFLLRFVIWLGLKFFYRLRVHGMDLIPENEGALILAEQNSFMEFGIITGAMIRPVRFVMEESRFRQFFLRFLYQAGRSIPFSKESEMDMERLESTLERCLKDGDHVVLPEEILPSLEGLRSRLAKAQNPVDPPIIKLRLEGNKLNRFKTIVTVEAQEKTLLSQVF